MVISEGDHATQKDLTTPPTVGLWKAIEETPEAIQIVAKGKKGAIRRKVVEGFLTTPVTQEQLGVEVGNAGTAVSMMVSRTVKKVFPLLPEPVRTTYGSAEQALRQRLSFASSVKNARRGQAIEQGTYTGKPLGRKQGSTRRG